jgi:hypothetical protein
VLGETDAVQLFHDRIVDHFVALDGILLELALFLGQAIAANLLLSVNTL